MLKLPSPALVGVIHLPALPGSAAHLLPMDEILERAIRDARTLEACGFDAAIIENYGDAPFTRNALPPASLAAMAIAAEHVRRAVTLSVGINALRNDARAALGIAVAAGASFIRVNVHTGVCATDQGLIEGDAQGTLAYRKALGRPVAILADVHVKHGRMLDEPDIGQAARNAAYRGLADGLIVTGAATGESVDAEDLQRVRSAVPDRRLFVGSGATADSVGGLLEIASGVIVGTAIREGRRLSDPIDADAASAFALAAGRSGGR